MKVEGAFLRSRVARRIVLLFVLSALVPVSALAVLAFAHVRNVLVDQGHSQLAQLSESYGTTVYERLLAIEHQARSLSASYRAGTPWTPDMTHELRSRFISIAVVEGSGAVKALLGTPTDPPSWPASARAHVASGESVLVSRPASPTLARVFLVRPLDPTYPDTRLVLEIEPAYLWGEAGTFPTATDFLVVDDTNGVLFYSDRVVPPGLRGYISMVTRSAAGRFEFTDDEGKELANFRELFLAPRFYVHGWTVIATQPEDEVLGAIRAFRNIFVPTTALAVLLAALLSVTQMRRTLVPLEKLIDATRRAANKDFTVRVDVRSPDEFGELAASFNAMASRLGSQFTALMTLADIDRAILSRLDVDRVLETVVMRLREIVPADFVSIGVIDSNATAMLRIYTRDERGDGTIEIERGSCTSADRQELLAHPEGCWFDASSPARPYTAPVQKLGAKAVFVLPIVWKEEVVGAVVLGFMKATTLDDDERARARDLGDRVGVAFATAAKDEQLYFQAHYDPLTQLPNRLYFKDQLARRVAQAQRDRKRFALLYIDLDYFKNVNDSDGHAAGDEVLREAADRLRDCVREADAVARLGGDEFTIILPEIRIARDAEVVANNVVKAMTAPFRVQAREHFLNASIGIALYPADGATVDDLLRNADTAMYRAKEAGRGRAVYFEERMNAAAQARVTFEREMRQAIEHEQFVLVYQPQIDAKTGIVAGAEALVRWNHPERGLLAPLHFIQLAEETGLIEPLGAWIVREACRQFVEWERAGVGLPRVAVNVSARQFKQKEFLSVITSALEDAGMAPTALEVEITESLLMDGSRSVEITLGKLAAIGVSVALDDFGTGYSSLGYLKRFPVDVVKIDRGFVKDLPGDESSRAITGAIVAMAHALQKRVVAEGVSEPEQQAYLCDLGCDVLQGFGLSRPLPADDLPAFVERVRAHLLAPPTARAA